jgi:thymidylate synthase
MSVDQVTALEAWRMGVTALLKAGGELTNLITTIQQPCVIEPSWLVDRSPHKFSNRGDDIRDVANTIFPTKLVARAASRTSFYDMYLQRHDRARTWAHGRHAWGTYFERLVRFPSSGVNQLERVIDKLRNWPTRNTTGLVFHLSSPAVDAPRTRGGPCWHFGELLWNADNSIDLVAVYRNHDFYNKVLGNFIGLGRLLEFICEQSGKQPGKLICHSVHAYHDGSIRALRAMAA